MKNPIGNVGMFATPDSMEDFESYMLNVSKASGDGPAVVTVAMMAWNLASKLTTEAIESDLERKAELSKYSVGAYKARANGS